MWTRRGFLQLSAGGGMATLVGLRADGLARAIAAAATVRDRPPEEVARDEIYWREIQEAFALDRTIINLNAGISPSPRVVHEALKRYLDESNRAPVHYMEKLLEPNIEAVRRRLAGEFGCDAEELAITRSATEALQIAQLGIDLGPGDEVVTTSHDYWAMWNTWDQRARRDRIKLTEVPIVVPPHGLDDLAVRIEQAMTPRTKVLLFCHMTYSTGQIFPVRKICRMARDRGVKTIVDGAHAFGHIPFKVGDLECDYYGTSLHKWLLAPVGTGFLYVRRENIAGLWPLTPPWWERWRNDIRKFEQVGTHPAANHNAIAEALTFHQGIGIERKAARLRYLRDRWARRLERQPRVRMLTNLDSAQSCGLATFDTDGLDPARVAQHLWDHHRILVFPFTKEEGIKGFQGIRVAPNLYTTLEEIDTFAGAMEAILRKGL